MKLILFVTEAGVALLNENNAAVKSVRYRGDPLKSYDGLLNGNEISELRDLLNYAISNGAELINPYPELQKVVSNIVKGAKLDTSYREALDRKKLDLMISSGLAANPQEAINYIRNYSIYVSAKKLKEQSSRLDMHIIQAIQAIDELDKTFNLFYMRLREWYGLHFPELSGILTDPASFVNFITKFPNRNGVKMEDLEELNLPRNKIEIILKASGSSKGAEFDERITDVVLQLAKIAAEIYRYRDRLARMLKDMMNEIAPNLTMIAGETIGARLISKAGSLERLAKMPASTIQILGAEKALFRALKTHTKPPKHGLIFQHRLLHDAPKKIRGKIARALATKIAIASRIDFYSGKMVPSLLEDLNRRIEEIKKEFNEHEGKSEKGRAQERHHGKHEQANRKHANRKGRF